MKENVTIDGDRIEAIVQRFIEALKKNIQETPDIENYQNRMKPSKHKDTAIVKAEYNFSYGSIHVTGTKEAPILPHNTQKKTTDRCYWELSRTGSKKKWPISEKSAEGIRQKLLLKFPRDGAAAVMAALLADNLNQDYYGISIPDPGSETVFDALHSERSLEYLGKVYQEVCKQSFSTGKQPPDESLGKLGVKVLVLNASDDDEIQTKREFEESFFTTTKDSHFADTDEGKEIRFKALKSIWKVQVKSSRQSDQIAAANRFATVEDRKVIRDAIIEKARKLPIINGLLIGERYCQLHALLRELCTIVIPAGKKAPIEILVAKPLETISHLVLDPIQTFLPQREYTAFDYVQILGKYAVIAGDRDNHTFYERDVAPSDLVFIQDAASPENRLLVCNHIDGKKGYRFRLKQFRLFLDAMKSATSDNEQWRIKPDYERTNKALDRLLTTKGMEQERKENETTRHAGRHFSAETFYAECYIEYVDAIHRRTLIEALENVAGNFTVQQDRTRNRQEIAISILSYLLYEKSTELSSAFREKMFDAAYGRSLYKPQGEIWAELRNTSLFYVKHAKEVFERSCELVKKPAPDGSIMSFAAGQPLFNFLLADLYSPEERTKKSPSFQLMLQGCDIQKKTWFLSENIDELPPDFAQKAVSLVCTLGEHLETYPESPDCMEYIYGLNMAFYGLSNLKYMEATKHVQNVEQLLEDRTTADKVRRAVLLCDYWNRRRNYMYSCKAGRYYLITGTIRFVCSYNFRASLAEEYLPVDISFTKDYTTWLNWQFERNKRYYFLMLRLLSYSAIDVRAFFDRTAFEELSCLPYDNMPKDADAFFAAPYKLYQESDDQQTGEVIYDSKY